MAMLAQSSCCVSRAVHHTPSRPSIDRIEINIESIESKKYKTPLLKELSQSSQDSFESNPIRKNPGTFGLIPSKVAWSIFATFEGMKPIVPEFIRIGIRSARIPGRSVWFAQKWGFESSDSSIIESIGSIEHMGVYILFQLFLTAACKEYFFDVFQTN